MSNYLKFFHFISGFFIALPLYFSVGQSALFIQSPLFMEIAGAGPKSESNLGLMLPLSVVAFLLLFGGMLFRYVTGSVYRFLFACCAFVVFIDVGIAKSSWLVVGLLTLLACSSEIQKYAGSLHCQSHRRFIYRGWYFGLFFVLCGVVLDFLARDLHLISSVADGFVYDGIRSSYGIEIYGFLVSFSAVLSVFSGCLLFVSFAKKKNRVLNLFVFALSVFVITMASRKAAYLDLVFCCILLSFVLFFEVKNQVLRYLIFVFLSFILYSLYYLLDIQRSGFSLSKFWNERSGNYYEFYADLISADVWGVFFGWSSGGLGGYSNLFVDVFVRCGFLGVCVLVAVFCLFFFRVLKVAILSRDIYLICCCIFLCFSFLIGNIVNLNFSLPYFVSCYVVILLSVFYRFRGTGDV
ncbi:hypothetical protein [Marinobacterium sp. LSUCC0821]|uniref:hypothetical protein n=1 Tax=Marinobacterium sp. LSUCC0821 TaxID=2668067 RepID=UPI0014529541|nr:hypothetical protein [Marinobacterium sp. LSUCC0821]QJD72178.1 hypothetical protein HH196_10945 [Marinobacterium sp. LSUCC0821]